MSTFNRTRISNPITGPQISAEREDFGISSACLYKRGREAPRLADFNWLWWHDPEVFDFGRSILQPPTSPSFQLCTYSISPHSELILQIPGFCCFISALQLLPKIHPCPGSRKALHPPVHLLLVHLLLSPLSQPLSSQLRNLGQLQPSTAEWELHKNTNLCSSPAGLLIQLFFLAFASFLAPHRSLPVHNCSFFSAFTEICYSSWTPLEKFPFLKTKGALKMQGTRHSVSISAPYHFSAGRNPV